MEKYNFLPVRIHQDPDKAWRLFRPALKAVSAKSGTVDMRRCQFKKRGPQVDAAFWSDHIHVHSLFARDYFFKFS